MDQSLTKRQSQILECLLDQVCERGYQPTYREIAEALNIRSHNAIYQHVKAMQKKGIIGPARGARALDLTAAMAAMNVLD